MAGIFDKFSNAVSGGQRGGEALQLALKAERHARALRGVPATDNTEYSGDIVPVLRTTCLLLEQTLQIKEPTNTQFVVEDVPYSPPPPPDFQNPPGYVSGAGAPGYGSDDYPAIPTPGYGKPALPSDYLSPSTAPPGGATDVGLPPAMGFDQAELTTYPDDDDKFAIPTLPPSGFSQTVDVQLSKVARQIIKLRDKLCMMRVGDGAPSREVLDTLYRELGKTLEIDGVTTVEDDGLFDHNRHEIVDMQHTDRTDLNNMICSTIRPGYVLDGRLVRSQEVIVYSYQASDSGRG